MMADITRGDLDTKSLQDEDGNWKICALCGQSANTGGSWLYAKHSVKRADRHWKTTEVWSSHGQFDKGKAKKIEPKYTVKDRENEVHIVCALLELRHPRWRK